MIALHFPACLKTACAASQQAAAVAHDAPGFFAGLWHGLIFPLAWIVSLFAPNIAIYAVPNNGGWYDFGFMFGVSLAFGSSARAGASSSRRRSNRRGPGGGDRG